MTSATKLAHVGMESLRIEALNLNDHMIRHRD
jgi:hypothetical protein